MKKINLFNIGVRLMHVVTSSQNIFYTHLYFNTFNKGGSVLEYMSRVRLFCTYAESIWTMHNLDISEAISKIV